MFNPHSLRGFAKIISPIVLGLICGVFGLTTTVYLFILRMAGMTGNPAALFSAALVAPVLTFAITYAVVRPYFHDRLFHLYRLAITDPLTSAYNRRYFLELAEREYVRAQRYGFPFAIVLFDIDNFKSINDRYGHPAGDIVLKELVKNCAGVIRKNDIFARYGGDEFILLLPQTDSVAARRLAERLKLQLAFTPILHGKELIFFTISAGIGMGCPSLGQEALDESVSMADAALGLAKKRGKDSVILYESEQIL